MIEVIQIESREHAKQIAREAGFIPNKHAEKYYENALFEREQEKRKKEIEQITGKKP